MNANVNAQSTRWHLIYNFPRVNEGETLDLVAGEEKFKCALEKYLKQFPSNYAYIVHDKDYNELGEPKTPHIHLILWKGPRRLKSAILNDFATYILQQYPLKAITLSGIVIPAFEETKNRITLNVVRFVEQNIRYLIHLDSPEKSQAYIPSDIVCNCADEVQMYLEYGSGNMSGKDLYNLIERCDFDKKKVALFIGPTLFNKYYRFILLFCNSW